MTDNTSRGEPVVGKHKDGCRGGQYPHNPAHLDGDCCDSTLPCSCGADARAQRASLAAAAAAPCPSGVSREHCGPCAATDALEAFDAEFMSAEAMAAHLLGTMPHPGPYRLVTLNDNPLSPNPRA